MALAGSTLLGECTCHEWHDTEAVGDWLHEIGVCHGYPVRRLATDAIWDRGCFDPRWGREKLTELITGFGGIIHAEALLATTLPDGTVVLDNGLHRWSIARDLGIMRLPVKMRYAAEWPA